MNGKMWVHPATVANVEILRQRGANFIGTEKGMLASATKESGILRPVDEIVAKALEYKKRCRTARSPAQNNRRRDQSPLFQQTTDLNYLAFSFYFLTALFFTREATFFATFFAGAFLAGAFIAGASFFRCWLSRSFSLQLASVIPPFIPQLRRIRN